MELIRAVIQGIANFWMSIFPLPQSVLDTIIATCRNFLWGKADGGKIKPLVAWSEVCTPKKEGGLGLFNLKDWNIALLSCILWDLHSKKDSLWVRLVHHYYFKGGNVWDFISSSSDSVFIQIRDIIISKEENIEVAKLMLNSWGCNEQTLAGKMYDYIRGTRPVVHWSSIIWNPVIPSKMSFILWLATKNRLLALDRAAFLNKGFLCPLCTNEAESHAHLFFSCRTSLRVWAHIRDWIPLKRQSISLQHSISALIRRRATSGV